jgi:hypothetical protein
MGNIVCFGTKGFWEEMCDCPLVQDSKPWYVVVEAGGGYSVGTEFYCSLSVENFVRSRLGNHRPLELEDAQKLFDKDILAYGDGHPKVSRPELFKGKLTGRVHDSVWLEEAASLDVDYRCLSDFTGRKPLPGWKPYEYPPFDAFADWPAENKKVHYEHSNEQDRAFDTMIDAGANTWAHPLQRFR